MTATILTLLLSLFYQAPASAPARIAVSPNHRFLQTESGAPFFWLADTAWLLFQNLDRAETEKYLDNRRAKGFNVLQAMVLHTPDAKSFYGAAALLKRNPATPNTTPGSDFSKPGEYDYWDHVDWVASQAAARGMYLALVPAWGSLVKGGVLNEANVEAYASFLARRYRGRSNIFWVVGGDLRGDQQMEVWRKMGRTLRAEDPNHLITYHPFGRTQSSMWFHDEAWLDFNMFQSGHQNYAQDTDSPHRFGEDNWRYVREDYARTPVKPVLDGEPSYENIPQGLHDPSQPYWTGADCRRYAYWSVFSGAFGHTYGDNAVMQFYKPGDKSASYGPRNYWNEAIDDPGSGQMRYLKQLMLSRPFFERVPDQSALVGENGARREYVAITRGASYLFAYTYTGRPIELRMGAVSGARVRAWWYSPRDGSAQQIGEFANTGVRTFTPPGKPAEGNDWVLALDDAAKGFRAPGVVAR